MLMQNSNPEINLKIIKELRDKGAELLEKKQTLGLFKWYISTGNLLGDLLGNDNNYTKAFRGILISKQDDLKNLNISEFENFINVATYTALTMLNVLIDELDIKIRHKIISPQSSTLDQNVSQNRNIFIVHAHSEEIKNEVELFIRSIGLNPIILHQQPNLGRTVIEKIEGSSDVGFAIIILTSDDIGGAALVRDDENEDPTVIFPEYLSDIIEKFSIFIKEPRGYPLHETDIEPFIITKKLLKTIRMRARQNVIFEFGFFIARIGRNRVAALCEEEIERPSDIDGLLYTQIDINGEWKKKLAMEINAAGIKIDNKYL